MFRTFVALLLSVLAAFGQASTLLSHPVVSLETGEVLQHSAASKPHVVVFFEPNCSWCYKQVKLFNQHINTCGHREQFVGIGVNGSRHAIKKEAWRLKATFPVYMASPEIQAAVGPVKATPLVLILDDDGHVASHAWGYLAKDNWQRLVTQFAPNIAC